MHKEAAILPLNLNVQDDQESDSEIWALYPIYLHVYIHKLINAMIRVSTYSSFPNAQYDVLYVLPAPI